MLDALKQKALEAFKHNCHSGIQAYAMVEEFKGDYSVERAMVVIAHTYFNVAQAFANNYVLSDSCDDFFPYVVLRTLDQRGQKPIPDWILKVIEDNDGIIPDAIDWVDGVAVVRE
jgi:hypothetical protein